ncbi:MAG: hypothetical protein BWY72_01213 [Bacteroidetes bacterium ADurb.Bin416]|nr:MAG: hypothetical protein BWY72_01213 [Bacteroidetes bacterium ADurb.Bin416]
MIVGGFAHHVHRCAFPLGQPFNQGYIFCIDQEAHTLLAFVTNDFLGRQGGVAYGQLTHVDATTGGFHQLRQTVKVTTGPVVMNGNNGVGLLFGQGTDDVGHALLHFGIGALNGVEFDAGSVLTGIHRRNGATTHADAVVVATQQDHFLAWFGVTFQRIFSFTEADTTGQHDDFVEGILLAMFGVFKGEQ